MKVSKSMIAMFAAGSILLGAAAFAQPAVHRSTPVVPARGGQEAREVREELWDLRKLEQLQDRFAVARAHHNTVVMRQVENELQRYLSEELRETQQDVREAKRDQRYSKAARAEVRKETKELKRIRAIDRELTKLYGRYTRDAIAKKSKLIKELVTLARAEVREARKDARYVWR